MQVLSNLWQSIAVVFFLVLPVAAQDFGKYGDPRKPDTCPNARKYNALMSLNANSKRYGFAVESFINQKRLFDSGLALAQAENHYRVWKAYVKKNCPDAW